MENKTKDPLELFVEGILDAKQLGDLDQEVRKQLVDDLTGRLMDHIDRAVIERLPEEKIDGLNELLDRDAAQDEIRQYISDSGVDVKAVTLKTMMIFRESYLRGAPSTSE